MSGTLPAAWRTPGSFPQLQNLFAFNNTLMGPLPAQWGSRGCFPELTDVYLMENRRGSRDHMFLHVPQMHAKFFLVSTPLKGPSAACQGIREG